jgi:bifunctional non-homologous end joining protein LigD
VRVWIDDVKGLVALATQMDVVELHPWGATVDEIERPDLLVFDLDPGEGIEWSFVTATAVAIREHLIGLGHESWCKTSGGKGLHVMVPIERRMTWDAARRWTKRIAEEFARRDARYLTSSALAKRAGSLFIDYLRNGLGSSTVGAFSPRARPGFPVSYPITWEQVAAGVGPEAFSMAAVAGDRRRR